MTDSSINFEAIPEKLRDRATWCCWREEERDGKATKVPVDPHTGRRGDSTDPEKWGSLSTAVAAHQTGDFQTAGVGFVFGEEDMVAGVDLDNVRDPDTGALEPWAEEIVDDLDSWTEVSVSGTGLHIYVFGFKPGDRCRRQQESTLDAFDSAEIEIYDSARFFVVTGDHLEGTPETVEQRNDTLKAVYREYLADETPDDDQNTLDDSAPTEPVDLDDAELVEKAKNAKNGRKFERLWNGDTSAHDGEGDSHSEARQALANLLAFWTGGDETRMLTLFERSDLCRGPDDIRTFENYEIPNAVSYVDDYYQPGDSDPKPEPLVTPDGGTAVDDTTDAAPSVLTALEPGNILAKAGLGEDGEVADLDDRQKAAYTWELIRQNPDVHIRVRRDTGAIWAYDGGVWRREGERALRHAARKALGPTNYGQNVLTELKGQARADPTIEVEPEQMGLDAGTLAVKNGLLDLGAAANGDDAVRPLEPSDHALTQLPVEYDPEADAPEWAEFVEEVAEDGKADALQEYVGYCLHVGALPIHRAMLLVGTGANGKSVFLRVVRALLGEEKPHKNTTSIELQTLANERDAVADFYGSLANIDDDLSARKLGNGIGMFKKLTGDNSVRGRHLYEDAFEFRATGKHLYAANQVPDVSEDVDENDDAFWRRWLIVEFPQYFPPGDRDPTLGDRLAEPDTLAGVLNWAIEGWARLMEQEHFTDEEIYSDAKRERWQSWGDSLDKFVSEHVERDEDLATGDRLTTGQAHRRYAAWCRKRELQPVGQRELTNRLKNEDVGYSSSVRIEGTVQRGYKFLAMSDDVPPLDDTPDRGGGTGGSLDDY